MAREDLYNSVNILELNDCLSFKFIFSIKFVFATSNMNSSKFESKTRNQLLSHVEVKDIFCRKRCISAAGSEKNVIFQGGTDFYQ